MAPAVWTHLHGGSAAADNVGLLTVITFILNLDVRNFNRK
jgi:hypothetical protein